MIQNESTIDVTDNSGAKEAMVIKVLGQHSMAGNFTRGTAGVGDRVICVIKKAMPGSDVKKATVHTGVVVRTKYPIKREDGSYVRFDRTAIVLIDAEGNPKGTRVFGAVARELREKNYAKIVSLAAEVV